MHPEVYSVIELGGQDAKIIVFKDDQRERPQEEDSVDERQVRRRHGRGDRQDQRQAEDSRPTSWANQGYHGIKLHKVAGKCGVFAETDINGLQKVGTPPDELMASLFDAIVLQNLSVLTRGHTLRPHVLLLGGPNTFIRGMREAWQANIPQHVGRSAKSKFPQGSKPGRTDQGAAERAIFRGARRDRIRQGRGRLRRLLPRRRSAGPLHRIRPPGREGQVGRLGPGEEPTTSSTTFQRAYRRKKFIPATFQKGQTVGGFVGIDGGSTSTKAVLLDEKGDILCKAYQLSNGNPIQDTIEMFENLRGQVEAQGAKLEVLGVGTTGYAKDILKDVLKADVALVETVAHTESALKFYDDPHVIVDVGGQDIKLIVLKDGRVKDFKLNTQCSAGNGYFLQSTAEGFGLKVEEFADLAFSAQSMPVFGYGCAVFMQSDIVNFQRQGWRAEEILAGLAAVLPKNVFLYVASIPNLAALGSRFVLQGGTQNNLAVVKAEVDFIRSSFRAAGKQPEIIVHEHCGESGAIGAGVEALRLWQQRHAHHVHRPRCRAQNRIPHHAQRRHALQFLQEQLPAHLHRHQDRTMLLCRLPRYPGQEESHQSSACGRRAAPDHRDLRKGHGRRRERHEGHQGRARSDQGRESEFRRHRGARSVPAAQREDRGRSDSVARAGRRRRRSASS